MKSQSWYSWTLTRKLSGNQSHQQLNFQKKFQPQLNQYKTSMRRFTPDTSQKRKVILVQGGRLWVFRVQKKKISYIKVKIKTPYRSATCLLKSTRQALQHLPKNLLKWRFNQHQLNKSLCLLTKKLNPCLKQSQEIYFVSANKIFWNGSKNLWAKFALIGRLSYKANHWRPTLFRC